MEYKTADKDIKFKEPTISTLMKQFFQNWLIKAIDFFKNLYTRNFIMEKELKYFSYDFKKKLILVNYMLLKIHKRLHNVPERPIISNCGIPTEKTSGFLNFHLKPLMQSGWSYIPESGDFTDKMKRIGKVPTVHF